MKRWKGCEKSKWSEEVEETSKQPRSPEKTQRGEKMCEEGVLLAIVLLSSRKPKPRGPSFRPQEKSAQ